MPTCGNDTPLSEGIKTMAKGFKPRVTTTQQAARPAQTVTLGGDSPKPPVTLTPGPYRVTVEATEVVVGKRNGTLNLAITARESASGEIVNLPPIWLGGGNTGGSTAPALAENLWAVEQLVAAVGGKPEGLDLNKVPGILAGKELYFELAADQINNRDCNRLVNAASIKDIEG
jgi:hypothetical protein